MPNGRAQPSRAVLTARLEKLEGQLKIVHRARANLVKRERRILAQKKTTETSLAAAPAQPATISAARFSADCVWDKFNHKGSFFDMLESACQDDAEDEVTTTFFFQHPNANVVQGMTNLVAEAQPEDDDLYDFPEVFDAALKDVDAASEFNLGRIGGCGGLQVCNPAKETIQSNCVGVSVRLGRVGEHGIWAGGEATVVVPYDSARYSALYAAAGATD